MVIDKADFSRGDWQCPNHECYNHTHFPNAFVYSNSPKCKKCGAYNPAATNAVSQSPDAKRPRVILKGSAAARNDAVAAKNAAAKKAACNDRPATTNAEARKEALAREGCKDVRETELPPPRESFRREAETPPKPTRSDAPKVDLTATARKMGIVTDGEEKRKSAEDASGGRFEVQTAVAVARRVRAVSLDNGAVATFDVGGQIFKISAHSVRSRPGTLLAQLLKDDGTVKDESNLKPIYVDATPSRFPLILDWYRHGEIHLPSSVPVAAFLQDARRMKLPDEVVVNGSVRSVRAHDVAKKIGRGLMDNVIARWPNFPKYLDDTLKHIEVHYEAVGNKSASSGQEMEETWDFPPCLIPMYGEKTWIDAQNLGSATRARVLALKLEERGYRCEFSETELVVCLPLRLQEEKNPTAPDFDEGQEEDVGGGGKDGAGY